MTKMKGIMGPDLPHAENGATDPGVPSTDLAAGKSVAEIFGEIVWLMTQDAELKQLPSPELEWLVMPPILLRQFRVFYKAAQSASGGNGAPVRGTRSTGAKLHGMTLDALKASSGFQPL
jgi:hypothetical protein